MNFLVLWDVVRTMCLYAVIAYELTMALNSRYFKVYDE